jgi:dihydropyrimidine dehydrogenase (NAD+) subunit PreA
MLGARICEYSSGLLWKGTGIIKDALKFLSGYMDQMGYSSVEDFIGLGVKYIQPVENLDWRNEDFIATIDTDRCTLCGRCANSICSARRIETDPLRVVTDSRYCIGCGLCQAICPENAVTMVEQKHSVIGISIEA